MSNLKNILNSFKFKEELNPKFWSKKGSTYVLKPEIRKKLLEIAYEFFDSLDVDVIISDIIFTGSLANFNWSNFSDVDLHLTSDYNQFNKQNLSLYEELFHLKKTIFNQKHDITIYGYDVELYIENENQKRTENAGIYSILNNEWVVEPKKEKKTVDISSVRDKSKSWMKEIDSAIELAKSESLDESKKILKRIIEKIRKYRTCGLQKGGEFSTENLVFKVLRRNGYINKIKELKDDLVDKKLSINEASLSSPLDVDLKINSPFGAKRSYENHPGVDLAAPSGTELKSPDDGEVIEAGDRGTSCGGTIFIKHPNGFKTRYCHIKRFDVQKGETVNRGQVIGLTGGNKNDPHRGNSLGAHLHFEVYKNGALVNPMDYIDQSGQLKSDSVKPETKIDNAEANTLIITSLKELINKPDFNNVSKKEINKNLAEIENGENKIMMEFYNLLTKNKEYKNLKGVEARIPVDRGVELIQTGLQFLGFLLPKWGVDGKFGPETEQAVKEFQKKYGLNETGVLNNKDLAKLFSILTIKNFKDSNMSGINIEGDPNLENVSTGDVKLMGNFDATQTRNIKLMIDYMNKTGIKDPLAQIGILSVISKESNFRPKSEVSYESTPNSRIRNYFGARVAKYSDSELNELKQDPEKFFNVIYANIIGNNEFGDGYKYRGRGFNQLTGKANYRKYGNMIGQNLVGNPDLVNEPEIAAQVAVAFFTKGKPASSFPKFEDKVDASTYFADINAGGGVSSHRSNAIEASNKFDVSSNIA